MAPQPAPGTKLGPYEILARIGKGGMGEVFRARDTRLDREVAIKISAEHFSDRFEREALAIAALNHANICTLFDVGPNYLVMELIDGPTLAERIAEGPIPIEEAIALARQIADALDAAHEKNIVHRDLKPGNIKVRPDGSVKVLDFGLAKSTSPEAPLTGDSPTMMAPTQIGVILGTAAYMAPEQARGKPVDKRADIWAFGVVLCEMVTGKQLFAGEDLADTLASVVKSDPNLTPVPQRLKRLLSKCLQKEPKKRLRDIGDVWDYLDDTHAPATALSPSWLGIVWPILAGVFALALAALAFVHFRETPSVPSPVRLQLQATSNFLELSPDGRTLAYVGPNKDTNQIWVRPLNATEARPLAGTDSATYPFWSPDGAWIGFFSAGKLRKISIGGGPVQDLCEAADGRGGTWNRDGVILFSPSPIGALMRIPEQGGTPTAVLKAADGESGYRFPSFLPDGKHFLFSGLAGEQGLFAGSLDGGRPVRLAPDNVKAVFVPDQAGGETGHLLFTRQNTLVAVGFNARTLALEGNPSPVAPEVSNGGSTGFGLFTVTQNSLVYQNAFGAGSMSELAWVDRVGKRLSVAARANRYQTFALSPDERSAAITIGDSSTTGEVWIVDLTRGTQERFAFGSSMMTDPRWTADGKSIAWSVRGSPWEIHEKPVAGGSEEVLVPKGVNLVAGDFSPDGKWFVYNAESASTAQDIWVIPMDGDRQPRPLIQTRFADRNSRISPDGKWLAWQSNESSRYEVYVQPFPGPGLRTRISGNGGSFPTWRADGKELYYNGGGKLVAVPIELGSAVRLGTPQTLFQFRRTSSQSATPSRDGQRFLVLDTVGGEDAPPPLTTVVLNWQADLKK